MYVLLFIPSLAGSRGVCERGRGRRRRETESDDKFEGRILPYEETLTDKELESTTRRTANTVVVSTGPTPEDFNLLKE